MQHFTHKPVWSFLRVRTCISCSTETNMQTSYIPTWHLSYCMCVRFLLKWQRDKKTERERRIVPSVINQHIFPFSFRLSVIWEPTLLVFALSHNPLLNGKTSPACTSATPHALISIHSVKNKTNSEVTQETEGELFQSTALNEMTEETGGGVKPHVGGLRWMGRG